MTVAEWSSKRGRTNSFPSTVAAQPRILLIGTDDDID
jgi:hypothetical protein